MLNVVTGDGETGAALVDDPGVDKIAFTGSTVVGREIAAKCGRELKRVTLELGGKSPNIILPDADLERAIPGSFQGIYSNSGQACNAGSRLFVARDLFDEVVEKLAGYARDAKVGPGLDPETEFGPLVSEEQFERVKGYIDSGVEEGAEASPAARRRTAATSSPTLFTGVEDSMRIAREEIFGPVLVAMPFEDLEEVAPRQRHRVRPGRRPLDPRRLQRPQAGGDARSRQRLRQHLGRRRPRGALRRLQGLRHRPREGPRQPRRLPRDQDGLVQL